MNPKRYIGSTLAIAALLLAGNAFALPTVNSVVIGLRHFNDCPTTTINTFDGDFASIIIDETGNDCFGFANRHSWSFSGDNVNPAEFQNSDGFSFCATVMATGSGDGEVGLRLSPWWSLDVDGTFMLNTRSGEIAIFGGRLPFYRFSDPPHSQTYVKGTAATLSMDYRPNGLSAASPGSIVYTLTNANGTFSSPVLLFDEGNTAEDPPHGLWGILHSRPRRRLHAVLQRPGHARGLPRLLDEHLLRRAPGARGVHDLGPDQVRLSLAGRTSDDEPAPPHEVPSRGAGRFGEPC